MKYIDKGEWPDWLSALYRDAASRHLTPGQAFGLLSLDQKAELRELLYAEQGGECCYCMSLLGELDGDHTVIEHQFPRNPVNPEDRKQGLDYDNLFLSCKGNSGNGIFTCDKAKGRKVFRKLDLTDRAVMDTIYFREEDGTVHSHDPEVEKDIVEILNLDDPGSSLYKRRFYAMAALETELAGARNDDERLDMAMESYMIYSDPSYPLSFREMFIYVLKNILGDLAE